MFGCGIGFNGVWSSWMVIPMVLRVLVLVGIIYVEVKLFKNYTRDNNNAIKMLNERYAMGEISEEEYLKRKNTMKR